VPTSLLIALKRAAEALPDTNEDKPHRPNGLAYGVTQDGTMGFYFPDPEENRNWVNYLAETFDPVPK
jgi:hypothetical protein